MPSPREVMSDRLPRDVDEFVYSLHAYISENDLYNRADIDIYLTKIYHSVVYMLTLHNIKWKRAQSLRYRRVNALRGESVLVAVQRKFHGAFQDEFLEGKRPQPPAHYVVEMFEDFFARNQQETRLLRFFGRLGQNSLLRPAIFCKAKYQYEEDAFKAIGVNVACDPMVRSRFLRNLKEDMYHPVIGDIYQPVPNGPRNTLRRGFWSRVQSRSVLVPYTARGTAAPRPPCRSCFYAFPGVVWKPGHMRHGGDAFPDGNCAEVCAFSKILFQFEPVNGQRAQRVGDGILRDKYRRLRRGFVRYLRRN